MNKRSRAPSPGWDLFVALGDESLPENCEPYFGGSIINRRDFLRAKKGTPGSGNLKALEGILYGRDDENSRRIWGRQETRGNRSLVGAGNQ